MRRKNSGRDKDKKTKPKDITRKYGNQLTDTLTFLKVRKSRTVANPVQFDCRRKEFVLQAIKKWIKLYTGGL
jgi:hypothetical protein